MGWFAVYRDADKELVSVGTAVADPLPTGLVAKALPGQPSGQWDKALLDFVALVPEPLVDLVERIMNDPRLTLNASQRAAARTVLENHLAAVRFRVEGQF